MIFIKNLKNHRISRIALIGDVGMYFVATVLGFLSHSGETNPSIRRMAATFFPFVFAWMIIAPWLGAYDPEKIKDIKSVWRPAIASLYAAPIGAFERSVLLKSPILVLFVVIMGSVTAGLVLLWRFVLIRIFGR